MAIRDFFDPDRRTKNEFRAEIRRRDEQIEELQRVMSTLRAEIAAGKKETIELLIHDQQVTPKDKIQEFENEFNSLRTISAEQANQIDELTIRANQLVGQLGEIECEKNVVIRELEKERERRKIDAKKSLNEYQKLLEAISVLKQKQTRSFANPEEEVKTKSAAPEPQAPVAARLVVDPRLDRTYYPEAHRVLMQREEQIVQMQQQLDAMLFKFGIKDRAQLINIPARLKELEQELEEARKLPAAQEIFALRDQITRSRSLIEATRGERDELSRLLSAEREKNSASEANRLQKLLDEAEIEIKHLKGGTSTEVWKLTQRAESAERQLKAHEIEVRNFNARMANMAQARAALEAENETLKRSSISLEDHHKECQKLKNIANSQKDLAESYKKQFEKTCLALRDANTLVERQRQALVSHQRQPKSAVPGATSFSNPTVLRWLVDSGVPQAASVPFGWLGRVGEGPWADSLLAGTLEEIGYKFWVVPDSDLRHLIVGRKGWSKEELLSQIDAIDSEPLRIYSQEMFVAKLMTGHDPFDSEDRELLLAFAEGHPALEYLLELDVPWPEVCDGEGDITPLTPEDWVERSPLHLLGYHVGTTSQLTERQRRELLKKCFEAKKLEFTDESSEEYQRRWGRGGSAQRLYRMAVHIKWLADGQGKDFRKPKARLDWINDLEWLRKNFYHSMKRRFEWP